MSEKDLLPVFTAAGLAAIQAAHQQGMAVKVTHIALGDSGVAVRDGDGLPTVAARSMVALGNERVRVAVTAGGDDSPTSVTMLAEVPAAEPEFWVKEVGFITDSGVLLAVWSSASTNLGWRGAVTPWVFRFVLAWTDLPPNAITIDYNGDAALNAWSLDQARLKAKVRHTVETSGQNWDDVDAAQLTDALRALIAAACPPSQLATAALVMAGVDNTAAITPAALSGAMPSYAMATGGPGYVSLPNGFLFQAASYYPSNGTITWTFPTAFKSALLFAGGSIYASSATDFTQRNISLVTDTQSLTQVQFVVSVSGAAANNSVACPLYAFGK